MVLIFCTSLIDLCTVLIITLSLRLHNNVKISIVNGPNDRFLHLRCLMLLIALLLTYTLPSTLVLT